MTDKLTVVLKDYNRIKDCLSENKLNKELQISDDIITESIYHSLDSVNYNVIVIPEITLDDEKHPCVVKNFNGERWMGQYVGFLEVPMEINVGEARKKYDTTCIIKSRFDNESNCFTNYILLKALGIKSSIIQNMSVTLDRSQMMEILMAMVFIQQIKAAFKKGLYRQYRTYENNDLRVRGKIDVTRHIKQNPLFNGKIAYTYREYTIDNEINRIILTAYETISSKNKHLIDALTKGTNVADCIKQLKNITSAASRQEVQLLIRRNNKKIRHSVYKDWEVVRKTAIMILRHLGVYAGEHKSQEVNGILINMPSLWERYLEQVMWENGLSCIMGHEEKAILYGDENKKYRRELEPDYLFLNKGRSNHMLDAKYRLVLDAKYKNIWSNIAKGMESEWKNAREDIFQVMAYMYALQVPVGGIICPVEDNKNDVDNGGDGYYISEILTNKYKLNETDIPKFHVLPLTISPKKKQSEFNEDMKTREDEFANNLKTLMKNNINFPATKYSDRVL